MSDDFADCLVLIPNPGLDFQKGASVPSRCYAVKPTPGRTIIGSLDTARMPAHLDPYRKFIAMVVVTALVWGGSSFGQESPPAGAEPAQIVVQRAMIAERGRVVRLLEIAPARTAQPRCWRRLLGLHIIGRDRGNHGSS